MSGAVVYGRATAALWRRVGGEVLLATSDGPDVDRLSAPASAAWLLLDRPRSTDQLAASLAEEFAVGEDEIAGHVDELLDQLQERGWLVRVDERG